LRQDRHFIEAPALLRADKLALEGMPTVAKMDHVVFDSTSPDETLLQGASQRAWFRLTCPESIIP